MFSLISAVSSAQDAQDVLSERPARYEVKNLKVKSFYINERGEIARWVDEELVKIDTFTGKVWKWMSEKDADKKGIKEYWQELEANELPMSQDAR
jgi:hypothetical protein